VQDTPARAVEHVQEVGDDPLAVVALLDRSRQCGVGFGLTLGGQRAQAAGSRLAGLRRHHRTSPTTPTDLSAAPGWMSATPSAL
jgi:hypothetical protein